MNPATVESRVRDFEDLWHDAVPAELFMEAPHTEAVGPEVRRQ